VLVVVVVLVAVAAAAAVVVSSIVVVIRMTHEYDATRRCVVQPASKFSARDTRGRAGAQQRVGASIELPQARQTGQ